METTIPTTLEEAKEFGKIMATASLGDQIRIKGKTGRELHFIIVND